jgi:hypothetical protein
MKIPPLEQRYRPHLIPLRATTEEREMIRQAAADKGLTQAALLRQGLRLQGIPLPPEVPCA